MYNNLIYLMHFLNRSDLFYLSLKFSNSPDKEKPIEFFEPGLKDLVLKPKFVSPTPTIPIFLIVV